MIRWVANSNNDKGLSIRTL